MLYDDDDIHKVHHIALQHISANYFSIRYWTIRKWPFAHGIWRIIFTEYIRIDYSSTKWENWTKVINKLDFDFLVLNEINEWYNSKYIVLIAYNTLRVSILTWMLHCFISTYWDRTSWKKEMNFNSYSSF